MLSRPSIVLAIVLCIASVTQAQELTLASLFSDSMVLQRGKKVPVWGTAKPDAEITVEFSGQTKVSQADSNGRWMIELDAMDANADPQTLRVKANDGRMSIERKDVLIGEVWLASGQSNMEWEMNWKPDSQKDIPNANHPDLRLLEIAKKTSLEPLTDFEAKWSRATPDSVGSFSAVGFYFGLKLHQELGVPVGIVQSAWGGTRIEPWTSMSGFDSVPALKDFAAKVRRETPGTQEYQKTQMKHISSLNDWMIRATEALVEGKAAPTAPTQPPTAKSASGTPTAIYNAMIQPLIPMALRGAIWYQGESNHTEGHVYTEKKKALLNSWRSDFRNPKLPFYFVQIAPYQYGQEDPEILARFWVAQRDCMRIRNTGMAVITDIANLKDIHPAHKKEVARRLALWALAEQYGRDDLDPSGPIYKSHKAEGNSIRVDFQYASEGLQSNDDKPLTHFEVAGIDGAFHPAAAKIDGSSVVLTSDKVSKPRQARFGWNKLAMPNLVDNDGLPACAFHTHWPNNPDIGENLAKGKKWVASDQNTYGWNFGLTDGVWGNNTPTCFATGASPDFPKSVTIDLESKRQFNAINVGVPNVGSTKTVSLSVSSDGQKFQSVGKHVFGQNKAERKMVTFEPVQARYVRLTYDDHHAAKAGGYSENFAFTSEVEVYSLDD